VSKPRLLLTSAVAAASSNEPVPVCRFPPTYWSSCTPQQRRALTCCHCLPEVDLAGCYSFTLHSNQQQLQACLASVFTPSVVILGLTPEPMHALEDSHASAAAAAPGAGSVTSLADYGEATSQHGSKPLSVFHKGSVLEGLIGQVRRT
jgi:hypothetical protein